MFTKKAMSPVVAVSLFIVITVISTIGFQGWFNTYQSGINVKIEDNSDNIAELKVEGIINNKLYIKSSSKDTLNFFKIRNSSGTTKCEFNSNENNYFNSTRVVLNFNNCDLTDLSKNKNNATLVNSPLCVDTLNGEGYYLDGVDQYLELLKDIKINGSIGISIFMKRETNGSTGNLFRSSGNSLISMKHSTATNFHIYNGSDWIIHSNPVSFSNNVWNHFVLSFDSNTGLFDFYVNGNLSRHNESISGDIISYPSQKVAFGSYNGVYEFFNGTIDEISVYNKPLIQKEVDTLYNSKKAIFYEQILVDGVREMDISECNLESEKIYNIVVFSEKGGKWEGNIKAK